VNYHPTLDIQLKGHGKSLTKSFGAAVLGCALVCGAMATIIQANRLFTHEDLPSVEPLAVTNEVTKKEKPPEDSIPVPLNVISTSSSPARLIYTPPKPSSSPAEEQTVPPTDPIALNDMEFEELDFENPFVKKKTEAKKASPPKKNSGKTVATKGNTSNSRARTASLAKKISKDAALISRSTPSYPRSARKKGIQGRVVVTVTIDTSGKISHSQISRSSGNSALDSSALSAAKRFRFTPAINGLGQAVSVKRSIPFNFQITG